MITQSSYNKFVEKTSKKIKVNSLLFILIFLSYTVFSQDSIGITPSSIEKKSSAFQEAFFKALTEKAINNHQLAINYLEKCHASIPNNKAVLFELSKNYFFLNKTPEALAYAQQALDLDSDNIWILEHVVKIYKTEGLFSEAIQTQELIAQRIPKKKQDIVYLYLQSNNVAAARDVLEELASDKMLNPRLRRIYKSLTRRKTPVKTITNTVLKETISFKARYEKERSFSALKSLLTELFAKKSVELKTYSAEGVRLYPAQPFVYLMYGTALNRNSEHKKAIEILQNGIDFVIDDLAMETEFYKELLKAYIKLGDQENIKKYQKKIKS